MPTHELSPEVADAVQARHEREGDIVAKAQRFERFAMKRTQRLAREQQNNQAQMRQTIARSLGLNTLEQGSQIYKRPDGRWVVTIPDKPSPPSAAPAPSSDAPAPAPAAAPVEAPKADSPKAEAPTNGALAGAAH